MENKADSGSTASIWHVLRVTYQREMAVKKILDEMQVTNFLPVMRVRRKGPLGKMMTVEQPAIHNYIFIKATRKEVEEIKTFKINYLRYVMTTDNGMKHILTVPENQMRNFIAVAGKEEEKSIFLTDLAQLHFEAGERVRVIGGPFEGVEGIYMRTEGSRSRRVVVQVAGLMAVATTTLPLSLVEKIE